MKTKSIIFFILSSFITINTAMAEQHKGHEGVGKNIKVKPMINRPVAVKPLKIKPFNLSDKPRPKPKGTCCTPVNSETMAESLRFVHEGGGLGANYTLRFNPSSLFKNQMQSYVNYIHWQSGGAVNAVIINWNMRDCGTGTQPSSSCSGIIGGNHFTGWNFNGNGTPSGGNFWSNNLMQVNKWYEIHTGTYLDKNSDRWINKKKCANNYIYVRISLQKSARGGGQLQISNGKKIIKTIPLK